MNSAIVDGQVLDFSFKKLVDGCYRFSIGDRPQGQIFKLPSGWTAVPYYKTSLAIISPSGFKTRYDAAQYILQANGIWRS